MARTKKAEAATEVLTETPVRPVRVLRAGTILHFPQSVTPIELLEDVTIGGFEKDAAFAGALMGNENNFRLNIDQLQGVWNSNTGRREE